ncbi:MAG: hypothetical protein ACQESE_04650 [Nanobdellota archaeon]
MKQPYISSQALFIREALKAKPSQQIIQDFELTFLLTDSISEQVINHGQIIYTLEELQKQSKKRRAMKNIPTSEEEYAISTKQAYENHIKPLLENHPITSEARLATAYQIKNTKQELTEMYTQTNFTFNYFRKLASSGSKEQDNTNFQHSIDALIHANNRHEWISEQNKTYTVVNTINNLSENEFIQITNNYLILTDTINHLKNPLSR